MFSSKIEAVLILVVTISSIKCSVLAPVPVVPALRYTRVAPPSVLPFSAQVNTFSRNLHVFDAPYAAGVLPGPPAIVQRTLLPAPITPVVPAPAVFPRVVPLAAAAASPVFPRVFPVGGGVVPAPSGVAPLVPTLAARTPLLPAYPNVITPIGRSIHTVAPPLTPPLLAPAPLLG